MNFQNEYRNISKSIKEGISVIKQNPHIAFNVDIKSVQNMVTAFAQNAKTPNQVKQITTLNNLVEELSKLLVPAMKKASEDLKNTSKRTKKIISEMNSVSKDVKKNTKDLQDSLAKITEEWSKQTDYYKSLYEADQKLKNKVYKRVENSGDYEVEPKGLSKLAEQFSNALFSKYDEITEFTDKAVEQLRKQAASAKSKNKKQQLLNEIKKVKKQKEADIKSLADTILNSKDENDKLIYKYLKEGVGEVVMDDNIPFIYNLFRSGSSMGLSSESIRDSINNSMKFSQLLQKPQYQKSRSTTEPFMVLQALGGKRYRGEWATWVNNNAAARNARGVSGTAPKLIRDIFNSFNITGEARKRVTNMLYRTYWANIERTGSKKDIVDKNGLINSDVVLGHMVGALESILSQDAINSYDNGSLKKLFKIGKGGYNKSEIKKVIDNFKKNVAAWRNYRYVGSTEDDKEMWLGANGLTYLIDPKDKNSELPKVTDLEGNKVENMEDFSYMYSIFRGLFVDKNTPDNVKKILENLHNNPTDWNAETLKFLDSDTPWGNMNVATKAQLMGTSLSKQLGVKPRSGSALNAITESIEQGSDQDIVPNNSSSVGGAYDNGAFLLSTVSIQRRLDDIIALLGGDPTSSNALAQSKLGASTGISSDDDVLDSGDISTGRGKSSYQSKQDRRDRKVDGYRTFIKMLIPALKALFPKHAMWDALKLLLLQFGHNHPKLAAAALLAGPPIVAGAATLAGKALLRGTLGNVFGGTSRAAAAGVGARGLSSAISGNSIMSNITSNVTSYKNNRDWINYMKGEIPELERKAQVGRTANLLKQNPPRARVNSDLLDLRIQEGLQAEKDLKYIRRTLPVREKYLIGNRINNAWNTTQGTLANFGGNVRSATSNIWSSAKNPQSYVKGAKGYFGALRGFTAGGLGAVGSGFAGFGKGLLGVAKGGLGLAKAAGPEAMLATVIIGAVVGAIKPLAQAIVEPFKIVVEPMKGLIGSLGDAFSGIWAAIKGILHPLIALGDACWEIGKSVGGLLGNFLKPFVRLLAGPFAVVTNVVINSFRVLGSLIGLVGKVIGTVGTIIGDFIYAIIGLGKVIGGWIAHSPIGRAISGLWKKFDSAVQGFFEGIGNFFTSLADKVVDAFRTFGDFITNWWESFKKNHPILSGLIDVGKGKSGASVGGVVPKYEDKYNEELNKVSDNVNNKELAAKLNVLKNDGTLAGQALAADAAANAAGTYGSCLKYVEDAVQRTYGFDLGRKNSAYEATKKLDSLAKSGTLNKVNTDDLKTADGKYGGLKNLPAGAIVVWGKGTSKHGHISIADGKGNEISDHIEKQMLSHYGGAAPSVYLPKGTELKGTTPMTAAEIASQTNTQSGTTPASATLTDSKVETTDGVRTALLQLAGTVKEKQSKYDAESIVFNATDVTGSMGCWGIVQLNNEGRPVH